MFLPDQTRRWICCWLWLLLGVGPFIAVAVWCVGRNTFYGSRYAAEELSRELGLRVTLDKLVYVRPGLMRLENLQLTNPESGQSVFRCRSLEFTWDTAADKQGLCPGQIREWLTLSATDSEVNANALDEIQRTLLWVMQSRTSLSDPYVRLSLGNVTLRLSGGSQTLTEVAGQIEAASGMIQSQVCFRLPNCVMSEPARITVTRNRQLSPPTVRFDFSTGGAPLPCGLLAVAIPELGQAGPNSQFQGWLWASLMSDGWQGEASGRISAMELDGLIRDWSSHKLSGAAELALQIARFRHGRLDEMSGVLSSGPGVISRSLLASAIDRLGLTRGGEPSTPGELVNYDQLDVAFLLNHQGLQIQGRCPIGGVGSILADRYGPLLCDPVAQPISTTALAQTLVPLELPQTQVAVHRQSQQLLQLLPLPDISPVTLGSNMGAKLR